MGKKGEFKNLPKIDKTVRWYKKPIDMTEYINQLLQYPIPEHLADHEMFNLDRFKSWIIAGDSKVNTSLKLVDDELDSILFIVDNDYRNIYLSLNICYPIFWYKFKSTEELLALYPQIYGQFNMSDYPNEFEKEHRAFMGSKDILELDITDIQNHLIINKNTESIVWGSRWRDHPFRSIYLTDSPSEDEDDIFTTQAMKQIDDETDHTYVRSQYSKSRMCVENNNEIYVISIAYNSAYSPQVPEINKILSREYPLDMPLDVILSIMNFPYMTWQNLLNTRPVTPFSLATTTLIVNDDEHDELLEIIQEMLKEEDLQESASHLATMIADDIVHNKNIEMVMDDNISKFIDDQVEQLREGANIEEVRTNIMTKLNEKMEQLNIRDRYVEQYVLNMLEYMT